MNQKSIQLIRYFTWIAPILLILSILIHINLDENQVEYPQNGNFLFLSIILMIVNTISLFFLFLHDKNNSLKNRFLKTYSILFGTPIIILLYFFYHNTFRMNLNLDEATYLRDDCFMKWKNSYKAENRYHYSTGYCSTATQDSIIVTEIYRWGGIKSCGVILNDSYKKIDTAEITFLTEKQKVEILSY